MRQGRSSKPNELPPGSATAKEPATVDVIHDKYGLEVRETDHQLGL